MNIPGDGHAQARQHDHHVIHLVFQRILGEPPRRRCRLTQSPAQSSARVFDVFLIRPDGPEVHEERGMDDVENDRRGQHQAGDPVIRHPRESDAYPWEEGRDQQREHRGRHDPVKQSGGQRVPWQSALGYSAKAVRAVGKHFRFREITNPNSVHHQERQTRRSPTPTSGRTRCEWGRPVPTDCWPTQLCPCGFLHAANGALHQVPHQRNLVAVVPQRLARPRSRFPRPSRRWPHCAACRCTASSTAFRRSGWAATPFTAIRIWSILPPLKTAAEAMFTSGKSHTCRSRTFSK